MRASTRWEVGSDFHWDEAALASRPAAGGWLPRGHRLYSTGSGAIIAVLRTLGTGCRLHLPSFFCMEVAEFLTRAADIRWYRQLPDGAGPQLDSLHTSPGDVVLAVNLFGREDREPWDDWARSHPEVTVFEDHSHDPLSDWARTSTARFCIASLRKTLPVPDGAAVWSPSGAALPVQPASRSSAGDLKLAAMILKSGWLRGRPVPREAFRSLQAAGEAVIHEGEPGPTAFTQAVLPLLDAFALRSRRARNAAELERRLLQVEPRPKGTPIWRVLNHGSGEFVPFNVQIVCEDRQVRESLASYMIRHRVFTPVHWPQDGFRVTSQDPCALEYSRRILTIPVDHRYDLDDVARISELLAAFSTP